MLKASALCLIPRGCMVLDVFVCSGCVVVEVSLSDAAPFFGVYLLGLFLSFGFGVPAFWWVCRWALMESLILAQDERWRRA